MGRAGVEEDEGAHEALDRKSPPCTRTRPPSIRTSRNLSQLVLPHALLHRTTANEAAQGRWSTALTIRARLRRVGWIQWMLKCYSTNRNWCARSSSCAVNAGGRVQLPRHPGASFW